MTQIIDSIPLSVDDFEEFEEFHDNEMESESSSHVIEVDAPMIHQHAALFDPARFKLLRCGRRWGKSKLIVNAAVMGHGPQLPTGRRKWLGISDGPRIRIGWIVPSTPQVKPLWEEEIRSRFDGKYGVTLNNSDKTLSLNGGGILQVLSAEAINARRGSKWHGLIIDEAAFMDLGYVWKRFARPTLADYIGWAIIASTTDLGSYFNELSSLVEAEDSTLRPVWASFQGRMEDNPTITTEEARQIRSEYPPNSSEAQQELDAELLDVQGDLFKLEYFQYYKSADAQGMTLWNNEYVRFTEIRVYADLAASMKQTADYTSIFVVGLSAPDPKQFGRRKAGIIYVENQRITGPTQIALLARIVDLFGPSCTKIESNQYQMTAVQHLKAQRPHANVQASNTDTDKRTRALPMASAMARGDVFWNPHASWFLDLQRQYLRFPKGKNGLKVEDHDDMVDCGSLLAVDLASSSTPWRIRKTSG